MRITRIFSLFVTLTILAWSSFAHSSCVTTVWTGACPTSGAYASSSNFTESNGYNTYVNNGVTGGYGVTPETQTLTSNSGSSWSVSSDFGASTHQLAFPITEQAYNAETVDNFTNIVATVNDTIPSNSSTGVEAGFLIYLDSWGKQIEIQHYVEKETTCNGTTPVKTSIQFGGSYGVPTNSWDLCYTGSMYYWQIVGSGSSWGFTSGSMELVSMIKYLETNGYLPTSSTINDARYGFMIYTTTFDARDLHAQQPHDPPQCFFGQPDHFALSHQPQLQRNAGRREPVREERHREQLRRRHAGVSDHPDQLHPGKRLAQCELHR